MVVVKDVDAKLEDVAMVTCCSSPNVMAMLWHYHGEVLSNSSKYFITDVITADGNGTSTLRVSNVTRNDFGSYSCEAINIVDGINNSIGYLNHISKCVTMCITITPVWHHVYHHHPCVAPCVSPSPLCGTMCITITLMWHHVYHHHPHVSPLPLCVIMCTCVTMCITITPYVSLLGLLYFTHKVNSTEAVVGTRATLMCTVSGMVGMVTFSWFKDGRNLVEDDSYNTEFTVSVRVSNCVC